MLTEHTASGKFLQYSLTELVRRILKPNGSAYPRGTNSVIVHVNTSGNGLIFIQFQLCEIVGVANLSCSTLPFSC